MRSGRPKWREEIDRIQQDLEASLKLNQKGDIVQRMQKTRIQEYIEEARKRINLLN